MIELFDYDAELSRNNARLRAVADVHSTDRVLDIGCGTGQTTREAARSATSGHALGVDLSHPMVARARELSKAKEIRNVTFEQADAQVHPFTPRDFTIALSRFGTMFFTDPVAAFTNIGRALRPGARLVQLVWQAYDHQQWTRATRQAVAGSQIEPPGHDHGAFSLADPTVTTGVLAAAGFTAIEITEVREPVYYGPDAASARDALLDLQMVQDLVTDLDATATDHALNRLLAMLDAHDTGEGVWFDSAAWLVTARMSEPSAQSGSPRTHTTTNAMTARADAHNVGPTMPPDQHGIGNLRQPAHPRSTQNPST